MNRITQHRPNYFSGFENAVVDFETKDDLFNIPFVKNFTTIDDFYQFSQTKISDRPILIAEYKNGETWWVVGYMDFPVDIVEWKYNESR